MAKRLFAMLLVLAMVLSLMPVIGVMAEEELDKHTSHEGWTEWTDKTNLPNTAGKYYLSVDVDLTAAWTVPNGDTHLCLNGHHIKQTANKRVITVGTGNSLSIYDCAKAYEGETYVGGTISGGKSNDFGHGIWMGRGSTNENGAVLNLYGGRICGNKYSGVANARGGAVYMQSSQVGKGGPKLNMYGGEMYDNQASLGGAVFMHAESKSADRGTVPPEFNMYGGKIHGNTTSTYKDSANATVGGTGTIYAIGNTIVNIQGGEISDNITESHGSVVFADNSAEITVKNAKITGNESKGTGSFYGKNYVSFIFENVEISGNKAANASALYGQNSVAFTIKDTTITGNSSTSTSAEGYGAAVYVTGSAAKVTVSGKTTIAHNIIKNAAIADLFINANGGDIEKLYVKNLEGGYVKFGIKDKAASVAEASDVVFFEGAASAYSDGAVSYMAGTTEKHVGLVDGSFKFIEGHFHEGTLYLPWTETTKLPDADADGVGYYLVNDVKPSSRTNATTVEKGATLHLCLNGKTIDGGNNINVMEAIRVADGSAYIVDCTTVYDENGYFVSGGKFINGKRQGNGAAIYVNNAASVLEVQGVAFSGHNSTETSESYGGGAIQLRKNTTPAKIVGCKFENNTSAGGGGAIALREEGMVTIEKTIFNKNTATTKGGAIFSTSGHMILTDCVFTGNSAASSGAINVTMASTATVEGCTFTGNTSNDVTCIGILGTTKITIKDSTFTGNPSKGAWYGAVNLSNGDAVAKLVGKVIIKDNLNKEGNPVNLHLQDGDTKDFDFSGLGADAEIGVTLHNKRVDAGQMFFSTTGMTAVPAGVTSDNDAYQVVVDSQGRLALAVPAAAGHIHCLCGAEKTLDKTCASCGSKAVEWTALTEQPDGGKSGFYYLENDFSMTPFFLQNGAEAGICLNGHKLISAEGKRIIDVNNATLSITDCTDNPGSITGTTGATEYGSGLRVNDKGILNIYNGKITGNVAKEGLVYAATGGTLNIYGGEFTGNTVACGTIYGATLFSGQKAYTIRILGGVITGNTGTKTSIYGGGAGVSSYCSVEVGGDAKIYGNTAAADHADVYLHEDATLIVSSEKPLTSGANIQYATRSAEANLSDLQYITGTPANWDESWVSYNKQPVGYADGKFFTVDTHTHKLCNDSACTSHGDAITFEAWDKTDSLPTAGNYYLTANVTLTAAVETTGTLNLCLNGKTVTAPSGKRILGVKIGTTTSVTDCGTTGKLTGGGATYGSAISVRHNSTFNLFAGKITGNSSTSEGTIYIQGGKIEGSTNQPIAGTFNMYGGEISGNQTKMGGAVSAAAPVGAVTQNPTINIYGGKISGNTTTDRGGAINASGKANIYIENAEISGNTAGGDGTIYATNGSTVTIKNAKIKNNNAKSGAAMSVYGGTLTLDGAVIQNNHSTGGYSAVHPAVSSVAGTPTVILKGATVITGNTNGDANAPMNLFLRNNVMVDVSGLTDAAKIGLYRQADRTQDRVSTAAITEAELLRFESDKDTHYVDRDAEGYLILIQVPVVPDHEHKLCGDNACTDHANVAFTAWTSDNSLPTAAGNYYLTKDVNLTAKAIFEKNVTLCLNGYTIKQTTTDRVLQVEGKAALTITDCKGTGVISGGRNNTGSGVFISDGSIFNMYGGKITGCTAADESKAQAGAPIFLRSTNAAGATFNMYGGEITGNGYDKCWAGAITNASGNKNNYVYVNIYGGKIYGNEAGTGGAIRMENKSVTTIYGGEIYGNEAATNGGAIYLSSGSPELIIKGGTITGNTAADGAGIYASSGAKITIEGDPTIYDNTASEKQNNLYLAGKDQITLGALDTTAKIGINAAAYNRAISNQTDADCSANFLPDNSKLTVSYKEKALWLEKVETSEHYHAVCADVAHGNCEHDKNQMWIKWGDDAEELTSLPTTSGYYYLTQDITLTNEYLIAVDQNVSLCLNGKTVTQTGTGKRHYASNNRATLNITDCNDKVGGLTGGNRNYGGSINVVAGSTVNLFAGKIYGNSSNEGGGVYLQGSKTNDDGTHVAGGIFNMYGGEISGNSATTNGAGIKAAGIGGTGTKDPSILNIYGGKVCGNEAKGAEKVDATTGEVTYGNANGGGIAAGYQTPVTIYGGSICDNTSNYQGGGIYLSDKADLYIKGGKIEGNEATSVGGGIFATGNGTEIVMEAGEICGNKSANGGGMITQTQSKFIMNGGKICHNESVSNGAGIYVSTNTDFIMNGGQISDNKAGSNGAGFFALRSRVTLDGGAQIINNTAKNRAGAFAASGATMVLNKVTIKGNSAKEGGVAYINRTSSGSGENIKYYPSNVTINDGALITENKGETNSGGLLIANDDVVVTMNGGEISKNTASNGGGVMTWRGSTFIMKGGKIVNHNIKGSGGGIYVSTASTFKMEGGSISNNTATSAGAVYFLRCNAELSGGSISNNTAKHTSTWKNGKETKSGGTGGAMYISGSKVDFKGTSVTGNHATVNGGAVVCGWASYTENGVKKYDYVKINVYAGLFSDNTTPGAGGAMLIQSKQTVVNVYGGTFTRNEANNAGAIYVSTNTTFNMTGGTIARNHAKNYAGALYFLKSTGKITGGQIYDNTAVVNSGLMMIAGDITNVTLKNLKLHDGVSKTAGGIVVQSYAHLFAENCDFYDNKADGGTGGAVYVSNNSYGDFTDCKFYNNQSSSASGAVHAAINAKINITRCDFTENRTDTNGGVMYANPKTIINITDSTFTKNVAKLNGGALVCRSTMRLTNVILENNSAENGGAIATDTNNTGGAGVLEGLTVKDSEIRNNTATAQGGAFYIWKGRPLHLYDSKITGNTAGAEGGAIWSYEDVQLHDTTITGNTSGGEGFAVYMNDANYDGHSYYTSKNKLSGNVIIKDNNGGNLWMGPDVTFGITPDGLGEKVHIELTLDSGVVTQRILGAYHYEGGNQVYTITYGDRSMIDPEFDASLVKADGQDQQKKTAATTDLLLYVGVGVFALAIVALVVVLVSKKKKAGKTAEKANKE